MSPEYYYGKKVDEETSKTRITRLKDRKRVEMEYLDAVKKQIGYWKNQMDVTDPQENEIRYDELKKSIEMEKEHIKHVQGELNKINNELKMEIQNK